ncbi:D-2-hydroxyglutarate dehydrogenase, mitochondrial-like isoform X2 [Plodia interpunctella]|uniref:D-2-hydroxyglutarate dehydrogenase, mitochondrial-like isoform X2 n=1 Tax=Plodia interpunctella TaxID=58824 RepID=UPI0023675DAC|nr:D-2-hydroxyglutarate dehydrogenase, mitochondrial-like isoform X2 [Plodia interpunctella]
MDAVLLFSVLNNKITMIKSVKIASKFGQQYRYASQVLPQLSSEKYKIIRKKFATVQETDLHYFKHTLGENRVISDESDILPYNIDWVKHCRGALICEAGCVLETLDNFVREHGLIMPLDLGAKGTCQIGGNVSTNAGGLRLLRYGNLHGSILGLEAVRADGTIVDCLKALKKDNTGYHLKHLFIGSEGTLGVVTKVAIHCPALPKAVTIGFFGVNNFENVLKLYKSAKSSLGEILSAFEMCDQEAIESSVKYLNQRLPIPEFPFYVLIETHGSNDAHDEEKLNNFLKKEMDNGLILDGTITSEPTKMQYIWRFRESIPAGDMNGTFMYAFDVSLPQSHYYELVPILREKLGDKVLKVSGFGHIGDGNAHINVVTEEYSQEVTDIVEPFLFEEVAKRQGSVSAEHGIGLKKPQYMHFSKDESAIQLMRDLKQLMDPNGILNPYKVLPEIK